MESSDSLDMPNQGNSNNMPPSDYWTRAAAACESGDLVLGMHLYLAAYEMALSDPLMPESAAVRSLRAAWDLACKLKERSMAEYVFEKLEPYLSSAEVPGFANQLQDLALDRLEQFGFSREDLEGMADAISHEFLGGGAPFVKMEQIVLPAGPMPQMNRMSDGRFDLSAFSDFGEPLAQEGAAPASDAAESAEASTASDAAEGEAPCASEGAAGEIAGQAAQKPQSESADAVRKAGGNAIAHMPYMFGTQLPTIESFNAQAAQQENAAEAKELPSMPADLDGRKEPLTYRNLAGYDETVLIMRDMGIGLAGDRGFQNFVDMMNRRHGLDRMPAVDSLLFRAPVREDAVRFIEATIGELDLPALRMSMEEGFQGVPVLCITARSDNHPKLNRAQNRFEGPGILVLEDLDLWVMPPEVDAPEGIGGLMMANMSRGAREAMNFIHSAAQNPDVYVLVSASSDGEIDPAFLDMLEPLTVIDIDLPTDRERADIWTEIVRDHPSMRMLNRADLMRLSTGMPRYDIYMAAREAVEDAYKLGLVMRSYQPVTPQNIYDKLAAFQPLDSVEYKALEDEVIRDFRHDLDHLEDLLGPMEP